MGVSIWEGDKAERVASALEAIAQGGGGGGTDDYEELDNKPSINNVTLVGNKTLSDLGAASASDLSAKYTKPQDGIPASDLASGVIPTVHNVPAGGSAGQVLTKTSGTDYEAEWATPQVATDAQVAEAVDDWLGDNVAQETGYVLDRTLLLSNAAAPADMVGTIKNAINTLDNLLSSKKKIISRASINSSGKIETVGTTVKLTCFRVVENTQLFTTYDSANVMDLYAFYVDEPSIGSTSYNGSRTTSNNITNITVPTGCKWVAIRSQESGNVSLSYPFGEMAVIEQNFVRHGKVIHKADINASGKLTIGYYENKVTCYPVRAGSSINATGTVSLFAFFEEEPSENSISYNASRTVQSSIVNVVVPDGCKWIGIRSPMDSNVTVSPIVEEDFSDSVVEITPVWDQSFVISAYGTLKLITNGGQVSDAVKISKPIPVKKGDVVHLTGNLANQCTIAWTSQDYINTYQGVPAYEPLCVGNTVSQRTDKATVPKDGYVIVSAFSAYTCKIKIVRSYNSQQEKNAMDAIDPYLRHNYVDKYDFVPNLEKKRTNSILTYSADNKKSSDYIVNAVAYPNGEIIACRAGSGQVVRIANDGTETVLLTIANSQDWRGVFMDSNLNVYVSPHSATFSPAISNTNRGLYRLPYGGSSFTKVISLCHDVSIAKWAEDTAYTVGTVVFENIHSIFYKCKTAHTSGSSFDETYWDTMPDWEESTAYAADDIVIYNDLFFICKTAHTSGSAFDYSKFDAATEYVNNDDTIWTMCEDADGNLYAGVYAHSLRDNPAVYVSEDKGVTWKYIFNFIMTNALDYARYLDLPQHVHCINYNEYDRCLYAAVGETSTIMKSSDGGYTWEDLRIPCVYGQPTYVMGVKDGLLIGSDGHFACGVSKLATDGVTLKRCGRTAPGFIFNIRRSDVTGWLYAFTRIDNYVGDTSKCPPVEAITDPSALNAWKTSASTDQLCLKEWTDYNRWASVYYPEDAIRPQNSVMMVSKDEGETWEVFKTVKCSDNYATICGFITVGYFRDGECLVGCLLPIDETQSGKAFVQPYVVSEGKKKRTTSGFDLTGEIFIKTNSSNIVLYDT